MKNLFKILKNKYWKIDKALHFLIGFIISENLMLTFGWQSALIMTFVIGLAKEISDSRKGGSGFDFHDLWATMFGGLIGTGIGFFILETINN
jgi:hypothetical protein